MMRANAIAGLVAIAALLPIEATAYPGGTPDFQTDVTPFCAACHASLEVEHLEGAGMERAEREVAINKHHAAILAGQRHYAKLDAEERVQLVKWLAAVDAHAKVVLEFPPHVAPGENFQVKAHIIGGAGPVVGLALVDRAHRWYARAAASVGWRVVGAPTIIGPDGLPQTDWLNRRPSVEGQNVSYVNVTGWKSDATAGEWPDAKVIFTLAAPSEPGNYPLTAAYFYGTEKAVPLSTVHDPKWGDQPLGGYTGNSGRVKFSEEYVITVKEVAPAAPADATP